VTTLTWDSDFERINRHRALAELVIHNRNWLPSWLVIIICDDFSDQGERYLRGEGLPPLPVRLWWAYKHYKFRKAQQGHESGSIATPANPMQRSKANGEYFKPKKMIPLAPGQKIEYIPVRDGVTMQLTDANTGERRAVLITPQMQRDMVDCIYGPNAIRSVALDTMRDRLIWHMSDGDFVVDRSLITEFARNHTTYYNGLPVERRTKTLERPTHIADYPRPNCPKCHTPNPELGTPLTKDMKNWDDSIFTCSNHKCRHSWKWNKTFPGLAEDHDNGCARLKGTDVPFHLFGQAGATVEQANEAIRKFAQVACIDRMTPEQRLQIARIQQQEACKKTEPELAKVTNQEQVSVKWLI
jgi:hypothetical protein